MIHAAIFVGIDLDIFLPSGELKPGVPIFFRINIAGAAHRVQPGVEFHIVGLVGIYACQAIIVAEFY